MNPVSQQQQQQPQKHAQAANAYQVTTNLKVSVEDNQSLGFEVLFWPEETLTIRQ